MEAWGIEKKKEKEWKTRKKEGKKERKEGGKDCTRQQTRKGVIYTFERAQGPRRVSHCG